MQPSYEARTEGNQTSSGQSKPAPGQRVMVTTANFRCLGYIDPKGVWRQSFSGDPLDRVLGWEAIENVGRN